MNHPANSHRPGRHCASSGLRDLMEHHGTRWTEAMCFGLGRGLGLWYLDLPGLGASRLVHVRSADLEERFFQAIGAPFAWKTHKDPEASHEELQEALAMGLPALIQTDIYHLPHYPSTTHFPGHVIVVWGADPDQEVFWVSDTDREGLLPVGFEAMKKARFSGNAAIRISGNAFFPETLSAPGGLAAKVRAAVAAQSRDLLETENEFSGVAALRRWLGEIGLWGDFPDWSWNARFAYQVIEKRGTGGGGFRCMYSDFLREAEALVPEMAGLGLSKKMGWAARAWTELALALKEASERKTPDFREARKRLLRVEELCRAYHEAAAEADS